MANIVERLVILHAGSDVGVADIRALLAGATSAPAPEPGVGYRSDDERSLTDRLDDYERHLLLGAIEEADGSIAEAARLLQTDRANLYRRMKRLGIER
ncbi:MAG: hypothetical protein JO040_02085 [Gemmatimonadetes bacterium]|nr:hypothetical protein [Gemmatimonadota bacterium]